VQHRERIVVLFSGSHRFEEAAVVNWSDYLINVKTLELSFLAAERARELLTDPVPNLEYDRGVLERIIELTHCQPFLLQAVASDLVNYLNSRQRQRATMEDLEVVIEKVLVTAQAYFYNIWTEECRDQDREVLLAIAANRGGSALPPRYQQEIQSLLRKEILEQKNRRWSFAVELFRLWILKEQFTTAQPESGEAKPLKAVDYSPIAAD
jgi:hypothetical protein